MTAHSRPDDQNLFAIVQACHISLSAFSPAKHSEAPSSQSKMQSAKASLVCRAGWITGYGQSAFESSQLATSQDMPSGALLEARIRACSQGGYAADECLQCLHNNMLCSC